MCVCIYLSLNFQGELSIITVSDFYEGDPNLNKLFGKTDEGRLLKYIFIIYTLIFISI